MLLELMIVPDSKTTILERNRETEYGQFEEEVQNMILYQEYYNKVK